ncbi:leader peptidase (prepilin peptidase)/N-methyltransferase [Desulfitobacterium sp. LBE]|uniref:prepilin peptidase n=1 Tax=Desulfitobacterium sp. LBE TaxID=884086 RepID=UPI00119903F6|nr:A24 family peptidase [Desulfitobacterium sp. LBE]TWH59310.1 leader peptidase (prepilin peptidase)/N-methyltransferase [Desulfitobacterium sp. LBE]
MILWIIKGLLFSVFLIIAAICDMRKREIPDAIPFFILVAGFLSVNMVEALIGMFLTGIPYLLAAVLIKKDTGFSIGGGDIKLMGACGFVLGAPFGALQSIFSLLLALATGMCIKAFSSNRKWNSITLPLAPFFCVGGILSYSALVLSLIN